MKSAFGLGKNIPNTSDQIPFTQTNERKTVPLNTRAIKLYDYLEIFGLEADRTVTTISTNLYIYKQSGKIKEGNDNLKGEMNEFSGFLGIMNVMGANFLVLVKDVAVHFVLDGREKIFEVSSVEFKELTNPQEPTKITKEIKEFLSLIEKILSSGGFYFSYKYPLTLSQQKISEQKEIYSEKQRQQSVQKLVDYDFMWNQQLMKTLIQQRVSSDWQVQLIQGHIYNLIAYMPSITYFTLISRRQTRRAGTRQNHRGIDSDGFVANCVETELIYMLPEIQVVISHVQIRGSVPCFWKQRGVGSKILIDPSKLLQIQACKLHLDYLARNYTQTTCVNLMNNSNHNEKKLIEEFQSLVRDCITQRPEVQYKEFDFHQEVKGDRLESVDIFIRNSGVMKNLVSYGYFSRDFSGVVLSKQAGIVRTNCLDCLDRTNFFQLRVGFLTLKQLILGQLNLVFKIGTEDKFLKDYSTCWSENGDKISWHYAGSDASSASSSKTGKQGVFGFLKGKLSSAKRFFQGGLVDSNKQQCYCFLLGEHYETQENLVFQEELQKQMKLRENQFTKKRKITIFAVTWNVGAFVPEKITQKFPALFWHNEKYDIVVFGLQELVELKPKNLMMSTSQKHNAQKEWQEIIQYNLGKEYFLVTSSNMVGVQTYIFAKTNLNGSISDIETDTVKCGFGGQLGNKGAVAIKFQINDTSFAFLNCHLPAGQSKVIDRVNSLHQCIYQSFQQGISSYKKDPLMRADKIIVLGDLNFRVERKYTDAISALDRILSLRKDFEMDEAQAMMEEQVTQFDQLQTLMKGAQLLGTFSQSSLESFASMAEKDNNSGRSSQRSQGVQSFLDQGHLGKSGCLHFFYEKKIRFLPTYKFDVNTDVYDTSKKQRVPSYCDRILICDNENENYQIENCYLAYESCPSLSHSDHKPVFAVIQFSAKQINCEARDLIEEEIVKAEENIEEGDVIFQEKQTSVYDSAYLEKSEIEQLKSDLVQDIMIIQHEKDRQEEDDQGELEDEVVEGSTIGPIPPGFVRNGSDPFELSPGNNFGNTTKSSHKLNSKKSAHTSLHNGQSQQSYYSQQSQQSSNRFHYDSVMIGHQAISERFQAQTTNFNDEDTKYQEEELKECTTIKKQPFQNTVYQEHKHLQQHTEFTASSPPPPPALYLKSYPQPQSLGYQQQSPPPPSLSFLSPPPPSQVFQSPPPLSVSNTSIKPYQRQQASVGIKENNYFNPSQMGSPGSSSSDRPQIPYHHEVMHYERNQLTQNNNNNTNSSSFHFQQQQKQLNNHSNSVQHNFKLSNSPRYQVEHGQIFGKTFRTEPITNTLTSSLTESSVISNNYQSELQTDSIFTKKR